MLPEVTATRYVAPLREGGSLPGLMEADDLGTYVVKFHGAGQGRKTLVAEVLAGTLLRSLGLPVPDLVSVQVDPVLAAGEPDEEVQDLLRRSPGRNLGVDYLPGALDFDPAAFGVDPLLAGRVLWCDALLGNVDRSWRNPNMLYWHGRLVLIDHGASLTFQHSWSRADSFAARPYDAAEHALVAASPDLDGADDDLGRRLTPDLLAAAAAQVPDGWLADEPGFDDPGEVRSAFVRTLTARLSARADWLPGVRAAVQAAVPPADRARRPSRRPGWLTAPPPPRPGQRRP